MKKLISFLTTLFILVTYPVLANELLVLSGDKSQNSKRWEEEVFPEYPATEVGKNLPARIVLIHGSDFPDWFSKAVDSGKVGKIIGTPTFIIWDTEGKKELGRLEGYTQKAKFFHQLNEAVAMVKEGLTPGRREGSGGHMDEGSERQTPEEGSSGGGRREGSSSEIMEHQYKTPEEARRASQMLGLGGKIHSHKSPQGTIYMPGSTM